MSDLEQFLAQPIGQLRERFLARGRPVPEGLLEALEKDGRRAARELARAIRGRREKNRSEGQRLPRARALVLAGRPPGVLLHEPTRGLDYPGKEALVVALRDLAASGHAVVLATHDVELAATVTDRTVVLAEGEVVSDGPSREVVMSSPAFAPQVAKVLAPLPWLTVAEVAASLRAG